MTSEPRIVYTAVYDTLADWEVGAAIAYLNNPELQREPGSLAVRTVGRGTEPVTTGGGMRVLPDVDLAEVDLDRAAALILPGANLWDQGDELEGFAELARDFLDAGRPVAAICGATFGLAKAGLLDTRAHTSNDPGYLAASGYAGSAHYRNEPAVTDGNVVTATSLAPFHFAHQVFAALDVYEPQVLDAWFRLFAERDPSAYAVLAEHGA
ncbi:DJ-1/PfpI family protein [Nocardia sp. NPDC057227]|uniref:DJ-1/PfpI family protein n=1 Tax=Nocardia sp. NPDC057227 TaxID=3346056 RepID=UPI00364499A4